MIRNGQKFVNPTKNDYRLMISNERLREVCHTRDVEYLIRDRNNRKTLRYDSLSLTLL